MKFISKFIIKYLDILVKKCKTDRTTFVTYVLTLVSAYIVIDRVVEIIIIWFTGMSVSYWGPIAYTVAIMVPWFTFFIANASKFAYNNNKAKLSMFYTYSLALYIVGISFFVQSFNRFAWVMILSVPNYQEIITEFGHLIRPALASIAIYLPIVTFFPIFRWMYTKINDPIFPNTFLDSINDYVGVDLNPSTIESGPYSLEINLCNDKSSGKGAKILDNRRLQGTLIMGPSGVRKN